MLDMLTLGQAGFLLAQEAAPAAGSRIWAYVLFIGLVLAFLALDLGVFHREAHEVSMKEAGIWSVIWLSCGIAFSGVVYMAYERHWLGLGVNTPIYNPEAMENPGAPLIVTGEVSGGEAAQQYLTGYIVEKSLAMDNIFVIALIFSFFAIPGKYQHRVLFWGIIGALLMRGGMIFVGGELILRFQWILIFFGLLLVLTAVKMALIHSESDPSKNVIVRMIKKRFPLVDFYDGQRFFTRRTLKPVYCVDPATGKEVMQPAPEGSLGRLCITPLLLALVMVEITDLVFAVDSIPAIFAITPDPFIVFTSNIFAILGLRSLYFCLAVLIRKFKYLKPALILILAFVGVKLLLLSVPGYLDNVGRFFGAQIAEGKAIKIDTLTSMLVVVGALATAVVASVIQARRAASRLPA